MRGDALFAETWFTCGKLPQAAGEGKAEPLTAENADGKHPDPERDQIDLTGIASRSSTSPTSFCRNGSA